MYIYICKYLGIYLYIFPSYLFVVHHSAKCKSEDNLLEDKKTFRSKVNETEKRFKDSLGYRNHCNFNFLVYI